MTGEAMAGGDGTVNVTVNIYEQLVRLTDRVTELSGKVDRLTERDGRDHQDLADHVKADGDRFADHESRLRVVERRVLTGSTLAGGAGTVLGGVGGYVATILIGG